MGKYDFEEEISNSEDEDDYLRQDIAALSTACLPNSNSDEAVAGEPPVVPDSDSEDDFELVRDIKHRYAGGGADIHKPMSLNPLSTLPPISSDDDEDDFETLRAITRRFSQYYGDDYAGESDGGHNLGISLEKELLDIDGTEAVKDNSNSLRNVETAASVSNFPKSAQAFIDAIKKNRSCQKILRSKIMHIESRIEGIKELIKRVKTVRSFQVECKKKISRALSQKQDARVQLISASKQRADTKGSDRTPAMCYGPVENSHVANYRAALMNFPQSFRREKWLKEERENLQKGIIQQIEQMWLIKLMDLRSVSGELAYSDDLDSITTSFADMEITPYNIREFLPKVNWEILASSFVPRRSGVECEARWLNYEDPLINRENWMQLEDKHLLLIVQQKGMHNWTDIAASLGTNRTPFQCLARYQRSLNVSIMKRDWTEDEDVQLRSAVEAFGESNWQAVASVLEGRTGTQCSNRWKKTLHPSRQRVGRWTTDEDKRLKVAVALFGSKSWHRISQFVPGRTQVQCRERWVNVLDPFLVRGKWTEEDDLKLKAAIAEHGYCWSKVAALVPQRTDNQCLRRWKQLFPHEVPLLQAASKLRKVALISNFVDRESERPALGAGDFVAPLADSMPEPEKHNTSKKSERKPRKNIKCEKAGERVSCNDQENTKPRRREKRPRSRDDLAVTSDSGEGSTLKRDDISTNKKRRACRSSLENDKLIDCANSQKGDRKLRRQSDSSKEVYSSDLPVKIRSRRLRGVKLKEPVTNDCSAVCKDDNVTKRKRRANRSCFLENGDNQDQASCSSVLLLTTSDSLQPERNTLDESCEDNDLKINAKDQAHSKKKATACKQHKRRKLQTSSSNNWEDLTLSVLFGNEIGRIKRIKSNAACKSLC